MLKNEIMLKICDMHEQKKSYDYVLDYVNSITKISMLSDNSINKVHSFLNELYKKSQK